MFSHREAIMNGYLEVFIILSVSLVMVGLNLLSHWVSDHLEKYHPQVLSFSAGLLVSILFIIIMEEVFAHSHEINPEPHGHFFEYLIVFIGFLIFHLVEKFLFKKIKKKEEIEKDLKELHLVGLFIDHFFLGVILATSIHPSEPISYLILIPLYLEAISSTVSLEHIDECAYTQSLLGKIILSIAPILGSGVALLFGINDILTTYVSAFALGAVMYIAIRDVIPHDKKGKPLWFLLGTLITIAIALLNYLYRF